MVLHTSSSGLVVEPAAAGDVEFLRHRDLHEVDVIGVPDRLEKRVREAEVQQVLHRLLAEEMIDSENVLFREKAAQRAIQGLRGGQVASEWLFNDHARAGGATCRGQSRYDHLKHAWWNGEIEQRPPARAKRVAQGHEHFRITVVTGDIPKAGGQAIEDHGIDIVLCRDALFRARPQLLVGPGLLCKADHRNVQLAAPAIA